MANFQLRNVDDRQWAQVATRAQLEGWPLRELMLALLEDYAAGRLRPSRAAPKAPPGDDKAVTLGFTCPKCNHSMMVECRRGTGFAVMTFYAVECPVCHKVTERALPGDILSVGVYA